jgi:hypothetical protein
MFPESMIVTPPIKPPPKPTIDKAIEAANRGDIEPLRRKYPKLAPFFNLKRA